MGHVKTRPELADAARDEIRVSIQLLGSVERAQRRRVFTRKALQIEELARRDRVEHAAHVRPIAVGERGGAPHDVLDALEQRALGKVMLRRRTGARDRFQIGRRARVRASERFEMRDTLGSRDQARVGDGVARAGEQVGETDRLAQRRGENPKRKIEASADPLEDVAKQVVGPRHPNRCRSA